jgi:hypothetical protein
LHAALLELKRKDIPGQCSVFFVLDVFIKRETYLRFFQGCFHLQWRIEGRKNGAKTPPTESKWGGVDKMKKKFLLYEKSLWTE